MRLLPYGDVALLVEPDRRADLPALAERLRAAPGCLEVVPAAATLLVRIDPRRTDRRAIAALLAPPVDPGAAPPDAGSVTVPVSYDGDDLALVARDAGCSVEEVIARHTGGEYVVAFCGFSPGFAYLTGLHPSLQQPRLAEPRASVPAGAVGIAGEFTGAYPRSSPGGWRLLGRTEVTLWDAAATQPALLSPGTHVRFVRA